VQSWVSHVCSDQGWSLVKHCFCDTLILCWLLGHILMLLIWLIKSSLSQQLYRHFLSNVSLSSNYHNIYNIMALGFIWLLNGLVTVLLTVLTSAKTIKTAEDTYITYLLLLWLLTLVLVCLCRLCSKQFCYYTEQAGIYNIAIIVRWFWFYQKFAIGSAQGSMSILILGYHVSRSGSSNFN
jgi:hypothetical protein